MSSLVLACLIFDDPIEKTFTIDIRKNEQISHLRDAIKEKIEHRFEKIGANDLELWKVNISTSDESKFEQLRANISHELILKDVLEGEMMADVTKKIKEIFNDSPKEGHIHIIVKPPGELTVIIIG